MTSGELSDISVSQPSMEHDQVRVHDHSPKDQLSEHLEAEAPVTEIHPRSVKSAATASNTAVPVQSSLEAIPSLEEDTKNFEKRLRRSKRETLQEDFTQVSPVEWRLSEK